MPYALPYTFKVTHLLVIVEGASVMLTVLIQLASIGNANLTLAHRTNSIANVLYRSSG